MGSFTLEMGDGSNVTVAYSDEDFSTEPEAVQAFASADPDTQSAIIDAGDMAPYFGREVEEANGSDNSGSFPELPQGSSRNKIEFLYDLIRNYDSGGVEMPNLRASFLTYGATLGQDVPEKFSLSLERETEHHLNADLYQSNGDFSFEVAAEKLKQYAMAANLWQVNEGDLPTVASLGFGVTFYTSLLFRLKGTALADVKTMLTKDGEEYYGNMILQVGVAVGGGSFNRYVDTVPAFFYEHSGYGYLVVNGPLRYNFVLSDDFGVEMKFTLYSQTSGADRFSLTGEEVDFRECKFNVNVTDYWLDRTPMMLE